MSKQQWNARLAKARLSTTVYQGERSELTKVQQRFEQAEESVVINRAVYNDADHYLALLPTECWVHYPLGKSHVIYLYDRPTGQEGRTLVSPFVGKTTLEAARKAAEYVERIGGEW